MKVIVKNFPREDQEYILPEEIGDMYLDLISLMNSLDVREKGTFGDSMGRFTITIERAE